MRYSCDMQAFRTGYGRDWLDFAITLVDRYGDEPRDLVRTPPSCGRGSRSGRWLPAAP